MPVGNVVVVNISSTGSFHPASSSLPSPVSPLSPVSPFGPVAPVSPFMFPTFFQALLSQT